MSEEFKDHLSNTDNWVRLLLVILFAVVFWLGAWVLGFVVLLGLVILMISGERNDNLRQFGAQLSEYLASIMAYATLNSDQQPFPFGEWPAGEASTPESAQASTPPPAEEPAPPEPPSAAKKTATRAKKKTSGKKASRKKASKK